MAKKRHDKISTLGSQVSAVISVSLVLLIVGLILIITSITGGASDAVRQRVSLVLRVADDASDEDISQLDSLLNIQPYASSVIYVSADEVLQQEMHDNAEILDVLGENPYSAEFNIFLQPQYVDADSIFVISQSLEYLPAVDEVFSQAEVIRTVNSVLSKATILLSALGIILLVISVVLLFNTISLVIYSRRFVIRTMQLVGATSAFIRRPFVWGGFLMGIISAALASAMLCALHLYASRSNVESLFFVDWWQTGAVCGIITVMGALLCGISAWIATTRFLHASHDSLYKR